MASLVPRLPRLERASASGTLCREPRPFDAARPGPGPGPGPAGGAPVTLVLRSLVPTRDLRRRVAALGREGWRHRREEGPADLTLALDSLRGSPLRGRVTGLDLSHQTLTDGRVWVRRPGGDGAVDPFGGGRPAPCRRRERSRALAAQGPDNSFLRALRGAPLRSLALDHCGFAQHTLCLRDGDESDSDVASGGGGRDSDPGSGSDGGGARGGRPALALARLKRRRPLAPSALTMLLAALPAAEEVSLVGCLVEGPGPPRGLGPPGGGAAAAWGHEGLALRFPARLGRLDLSGCHGADDALLAALAACTALRELSLADCPRVTDRGLAALAPALGGVTALRLRGCRRVTDGGLRCLAACGGLARVDLSELPGVDGYGLARVPAARLSRLSFANSRGLSDAALAWAAGGGGRDLEVLDLYWCFRVSDAGLEAVSRLPALRELSLRGCSGTRLTAAGLAACLPRLAGSLEDLSVAEVDAAGAGAGAWLPALAGLTRLVLMGCEGAGDAAAAAAAALPRLRYLNVRRCPAVTPAGAAALAASRPLRTLLLDAGLEGGVEGRRAALGLPPLAIYSADPHGWG